MNKDILQLVLFGTIFFVVIILLVVGLIMEYQRKLFKKNKETFMAVMAAQEREQQRIGKDLHDSVIPIFSAVRGKIGLIEMLAEERGVDATHFKSLDVLLAESGRIIREASHGLMPSALAVGLKPALENYVVNVQYPHLKIQLFDHNFPIELKEYARTHIYRVIQELIHNSVKHSGGSFIKLYIFSLQPNIIQLIIKDNGIGVAQTEDSVPGIGHQNVINRVKLLKGACTFYKCKPSGLGVHLKFDVKKWK